LQGLEFLRTNREEGIAIAAQQLDIPPEELASALNGVRLPDLQANLELLANPQSDRYLLNSMQSLAQFLKAQGQIQQVPDLAPLIEPKFLLRIDSV
jgi:NitT/TauT family transport system substrate-binding protein